MLRWLPFVEEGGFRLAPALSAALKSLRCGVGKISFQEGQMGTPPWCHASQLWMLIPGQFGNDFQLWCAAEVSPSRVLGLLLRSGEAGLNLATLPGLRLVTDHFPDMGMNLTNNPAVKCCFP